jgi:pilus assembly protein CpaB
VATERIAPRELVTRFRLAPEGAAAGLSALIPGGFRAMTVKVDDEGEIAGFLAPGTLVDVLAVINPPNDGASQNPVSKIILQNIKVLAGGHKPDQPKSGRESGAKSVTLLVTPEQAEKLVLSSVDGKLKLALRNSVDHGDERTPGADKSTLLGGSQALSGLATSPAASLAAGSPGDERRDGASRAPRSRARPVMASVAEPVTAAAPPPAPALARPPIVIYEGVKKRDVVFPY